MSSQLMCFGLTTFLQLKIIVLCFCAGSGLHTTKPLCWIKVMLIGSGQRETRLHGGRDSKIRKTNPKREKPVANEAAVAPMCDFPACLLLCSPLISQPAGSS